VWTKVVFRRPKTRVTGVAHKVKSVSYQKFPTYDKYAIIKFPVSSESAIRTVEDNNTLVFMVDPKATKTEIKKACERLYNFKPVKVNTLITPDGTKKAYVKVPKEQEALEIANKIGIM
jgi:large subunit ribosomal protein L23Ae